MALRLLAVRSIVTVSLYFLHPAWSFLPLPNRYPILVHVGFFLSLLTRYPVMLAQLVL
jgi:hypothetical protein